MVPLMTLLASCEADASANGAPHFNYLGLMNTMMPLMMTSALYHAKASHNQKLMLHPIEIKLI